MGKPWGKQTECLWMHMAVMFIYKKVHSALFHYCYVFIGKRFLHVNVRIRKLENKNCQLPEKKEPSPNIQRMCLINTHILIALLGIFTYNSLQHILCFNPKTPKSQKIKF